MDFTFSDEQLMMAAACRDLLSKLCSAQELRAAAQGERDTGRSWRQLTELGLAGVLAPAERGGMGLSDIDFVLIAEEAGRAALPDTLVEHAGIAVPLLASLASDLRANYWLARAASGEARIAVGAACNPFVLGAKGADALLLAHGDEVHLIERDAVKLTDEPSIDPLRDLSRVEWTPNAATRIADAYVGGRAWAQAISRGAVYAAAQCAGLADKMIELAVAYSTQRTQFGKPIGSYQAIKHQLANVKVKLEFARPVIYHAAMCLADLDDRAAMTVSSAKLAASDAAELAARTALQVHGAMGYSWEVDLHFYMKRAWALAGTWGDRNSHARRVQALLFDGAVAIGPGETFSQTGS